MPTVGFNLNFLACTGCLYHAGEEMDTVAGSARRPSMAFLACGEASSGWTSHRILVPTLNFVPLNIYYDLGSHRRLNFKLDPD